MTRFTTDLRRSLTGLHVLTDRKWSRGRDLVTVASAAIDGGATVIQLRDKNASTRELITEGLALRELTRQRGVLFIVNDRIDVALAVDADGAHVGQDDMPADLAHRLLGPERILGISAGNLREATAALASSADYVGVGPIYATRGKTDAGDPIGLNLLTKISARTSVPLVAIGGINASNAAAVIQAGASGIAVITAVVNAADISGAARELKNAITQAWSEDGRTL